MPLKQGGGSEIELDFRRHQEKERAGNDLVCSSWRGRPRHLGSWVEA